MDDATYLYLLLIFAIASGLLANRYQRSVFWWVILGLLFGPFALLFLVCMGKKNLPENSPSPNRGYEEIRARLRARGGGQNRG